jgi:hypothetical protein
MGHTVWVGRLLSGHTALAGGWWVGSTGQYEDRTEVVRQPVHWVRPHPDRLCGSWQVFERLAGDIAFETAHDLCR